MRIELIFEERGNTVIDEEKAKLLELDGFVMKPVSKSKIAKAIRDVLDK